MSRILGVDPGSTGALAWLNADGTGHWEPMPAVPKVGIQLATLRDLLEADRPDYAILERAAPRPGEGAVQSFAYGRGFGSIEALLCALRIPYETVPSQTWHRDLCGVVTVRRKKDAEGEAGPMPPKGSAAAKALKAKARAEAKARALQVVEQRLPRFALPKTKAKREAVVDAACLALWGRRHAPSFTDEAPRIPALALASSER